MGMDQLGISVPCHVKLTCTMCLHVHADTWPLTLELENNRRNIKRQKKKKPN